MSTHRDFTAAIDAGRELLDLEAAAVSAVRLDDSFATAVELVLSAPGRIIVAGVGTSGPVARRLAHLLSACGSPAVYLHPADALHGGLGAVTTGDVVITVSKGGRSAELNDFAARCKERGAHLLVLTGSPDSPLAALADVAVELPDTPGADPGGVIAMGSSLVASAWGDAFTWALMRLSGYSWESVLQAHPAGAVGHLTPGDISGPPSISEQAPKNPAGSGVS
jgi:D-arabinose 5-phosphate isomerase GutQ